MLEGKSVVISYVRSKRVPVVCRHVQLLQSVDDAERLPPGPAVVLASLPSLEGGPARELLTRWATGEHNLIVVPGRPLVRPSVCRQHCAIPPCKRHLLSLCGHVDQLLSAAVIHQWCTRQQHALDVVSPL
jgi:Cft2 family RNA processing exonuclease